MPSRDTDAPEASPSASDRSTRRRLIAALVAFGLVATVGAVFRLACVGHACDVPASATADVPFCRLPGDVRRAIANGFRDGRSPNVMAVARPPVHGGTAFAGETGPAWPRSAIEESGTVPLAFFGTGVDPSSEIPEEVTLDRVAPTIAEIVGLEREHPEVRSGTAIQEIANGERPRLVVLVALDGASGSTLDPGLVATLQAGDVASSLQASTGSEPLDPAAVATTVGTGGLPFQHGITGTLVRNDQGKLVKAWGRGSPISVIATLGDDLDESSDQRARIGLVARDISYRGLIGGDWYIDNDADDVLIAGEAEVAGTVGAARRILRSGYGTDTTTDLLAVVLSGDADGSGINALQETAREVSDGSSMFVVVGLGPRSRDGVAAHDIETDLNAALGVDAVEATAPGGFFIDQEVLAAEAMPEDAILAALTKMKTPDGSRLFSDVFTSIAVSFERYC